METALNLLWLGVSLTLLLVSSLRVIQASQNRSRAMAAVALVCLICLLFPVISMTDDLNSGTLALPEPIKLKKFLSLTYLFAAVLPRIAFPMKPAIERRAFQDGRVSDVRVYEDRFAFQLSRRPPPSLS